MDARAAVSPEPEGTTHRPRQEASPQRRSDRLLRILRASVLAVTALGVVPLARTWADAPIRLGHEFVVSSSSGYYSFQDNLRPDVASAPSGQFVVVWEQLASGYILGQRYDALGTKKGGEFLVSPDTGESVNFPSVAAAGDGRFVVVWEGYPASVGYGYGILGQRFSSAGAPVGNSFAVNTTPSTYYRSSVAAWPDGGFVVAWANFGGYEYGYGTLGDGDGVGILARRFDSTGAPIGNEFVVNTYTTGYQDDPAVAAAADGSFVVVWADQYQGYGEGLVVGQRYDSAGAPQGGEFVINTTPCGYCISRVAAGPDGRFVVVWDSMSGRRFDSAGTAQGGEFVIPSTPGTHALADVAMASDGSFVVAWLSGTGFFDLDDVRARRFDSAGAPQGDDFQVNEVLRADSYLGSIPAVSGPGDGTFVVTWLSPGDSGNYIAGARFGVGSVGCSPEALSTCREPTAENRGVFRFRDSANDARDSLSWRWAKGEATSAPELGDPFTGTAYAFCVYDGSARPQPLLSMESTAAGLCGKAPCWKRFNGDVIEYFDLGRVSEGLERVRLTPQIAGKARVIVQARGVNLDLPALPLAAGVTVQLQGSNGTCWSATYPSANIRKNADGRFRALPAIGSPSAAFLDASAAVID